MSGFAGGETGETGRFGGAGTAGWARAAPEAEVDAGAGEGVAWACTGPLASKLASAADAVDESASDRPIGTQHSCVAPRPPTKWSSSDRASCCDESQNQPSQR
jgi:hypothetical protein